MRDVDMIDVIMQGCRGVEAEAMRVGTGAVGGGLAGVRGIHVALTASRVQDTY
jgi:hypothetical protein